MQDMISVYFLSTEKKAQVDALVAAGLAVKQETIADSVSEMSLRPTEQLLALCPLQAVKGALGCITRYEIKSRSLDIRTNSIVDIAPESPDDYATVIENAGLWTQYSLGDSIYANTLGERHADVMNQEFALNRRYRKAFMVSPVIPWRATDLRVEGFSSTLNVAQFSLSFVLLAFDQNVGISYEPTVQVSIPGSLPIEPDEFEANLELQSAISSAYAQGLGLPDSSVSIDPDSITSETVNVTDDTNRRRRLLATKTVTKYECVVKFYETETTDTGESVAAQKAAEIVDVLTEAESPVADILFEKVTTHFLLCFCLVCFKLGDLLKGKNVVRSKKPSRKSAPTASSRPRPTSSRRSSSAPSSRPRCARTTAAWTLLSPSTSPASAAARPRARRAWWTASSTRSARAARSTTSSGRPSAVVTTS